MYKSYKIQILLTILILLFLTLPKELIKAQSYSIAEKLSGKIVLQVESLGEAWYINPVNRKRYSIGKPIDALNLMHELGVGINNQNLKKIPIGIIEYNDIDTDNDGLNNRFEINLGTNPNASDTDNDGYDDLIEIQNNYDPNTSEKLPIDFNFAKTKSGIIFLQIEKNGEAWYVNPDDNKRYFLGKPTDALEIMKKLGLGISNIDLKKIDIAGLETPLNNDDPPITLPKTDPKPISASASIAGAANAIRSNDPSLAENYFVSRMKKIIKYNINNMSNESLFDLAEILTNAELSESTNNEKIYSNDVYFPLGGQDIHIEFIIQKQKDDTWLITNL